MTSTVTSFCFQQRQQFLPANLIPGLGQYPEVNGTQAMDDADDDSSMYGNTWLITSSQQCQEAFGYLSQVTSIALDCEGVNLSRTGRLCLVQVYADGYSYIFDLVDCAAEVRQEMVRGLAALLQNEQVEVVMHDSRQDAVALMYQCGGILINNVFDTQVAHGMIEDLQGCYGALGKVPGRIGLNRLLKANGLVQISTKDRMKAVMQEQPDFWQRRPLPDMAIEYASQDVSQLLDLAEAQKAALGPLPLVAVRHLSAVHAEWFFEEGQRHFSRRTTPASISADEDEDVIELSEEYIMSVDVPNMDVSFDPLHKEEEGSQNNEAGRPDTAPLANAIKATLPAPKPAIKEDRELKDLLQWLPWDVQDNVRQHLHQQATAWDRARGDPPEVREICLDIGQPLRLQYADGTDASLGPSSNVQQAVLHIGQQYNKHMETVLGIKEGPAIEAAPPATSCMPPSSSAAPTTQPAAKGKNSRGTPAAPAAAVQATKLALTDPFARKNRLGIPARLHRIAVIRGGDDFDAPMVGLTFHVGRHHSGLGDAMFDVLHRMCRSGASLPSSSGRQAPGLLVVGSRQSGKTNLLRELAHHLSDRLAHRVIVIDTTNAIGGSAAVPHALLRKARRISVPSHGRQWRTIAEAVQDHCPEVLVIDEVSRREECSVIASAVQRGVMVVAGICADSLATLAQDEALNCFVGGVETGLGDTSEGEGGGEEGQLTTRRMHEPPLSSLVELLSPLGLRFHSSTAIAMDSTLQGRSPAAQLRYKNPQGKFVAQLELASRKQAGQAQAMQENGVVGQREEEELALLTGFMRQLRARANWEVTKQAGL